MATYTHEQLMELWVLAGGTEATADTAAAIAQAESGGCQYAKAGPVDDRPVKQCTYRYTTGENSYGLWQINRQAHPSYSAASLYTPTGNANAAAAIASFGASFTPWSTYTNGAYKQYLKFGGTPTAQPGAGDDLISSNVGNRSINAWHRLGLALGGPVQRSLTQSGRLRAATLRKMGGT